MRLIGCHIENFGKLHDETLSFAQDFHVIREPNGWGKSTLAAFLRVMFYGFEGETKRKGTENERKRFEPWQGGVYGGQLTFEANGKIYTATRIFSDKKANDTFELRDAATNLKSTDFSEALGEELFAINGESFRRTVFLGQNDCVTHATDSINAKIGNITDNLNDLDCYEKADASLQEVLNNLTPRRKTGRLSKVNDEVTRLKTEVAQSAALEDAMRDCAAREAEAEERLREKKMQQEELFALSREVSRAQDRKADQAAYRQLTEACARADAAYRQAEQWFPNGVPSEAEVQAALDACDEAERAGERAQMYLVTADEKEQLQAFKDAVQENLQSGKGEEKNARAGRLAVILCGVICALLGLVLRQGSTWQWTLLPIAGAVLVIAGVLMWRQDRRAEEEQNAAFVKMEQSLAAEQSVRQEAMEEKQQNYQTYQEQSRASRAFAEERIRNMGLTPTEPLKDQLREIWRRRLEWERAKADAETARKQRQAFADGHDPETLTAEQTDTLPSLEELHRLQQQADAEAEQLRAQADGYRRQLAVQQDKSEELAETEERLAAMQTERALLKEQYEHVRLAKEYLATAKETMTAKYMAPLMQSFSKYYLILTGEDAGRYRMDANTNVTVEECGVQRETVYLSRGWQDMTGLCLRLALADAMYRDEKPFLILDDPLLSLDEEHTDGGKRLMRALAREYQVIYFTCR